MSTRSRIREKRKNNLEMEPESPSPVSAELRRTSMPGVSASVVNKRSRSSWGTAGHPPVFLWLQHPSAVLKCPWQQQREGKGPPRDRTKMGCMRISWEGSHWRRHLRSENQHEKEERKTANFEQGANTAGVGPPYPTLTLGAQPGGRRRGLWVVGTLGTWATVESPISCAQAETRTDGRTPWMVPLGVPSYLLGSTKAERGSGEFAKMPGVMQNTHAVGLGHTKFLLYQISHKEWNQGRCLVRQVPARTVPSGVPCHSTRAPMPTISLAFGNFTITPAQGKCIHQSGNKPGFWDWKPIYWAEVSVTSFVTATPD